MIKYYRKKQEKNHVGFANKLTLLLFLKGTQVFLENIQYNKLSGALVVYSVTMYLYFKPSFCLWIFQDVLAGHISVQIPCIQRMINIHIFTNHIILTDICVIRK